MSVYYVLGGCPRAPWVLNLEGGTAAECARKIAWQRQGQGQFERADYWRVAEFDPFQNAFVTTEGDTFEPGRGCYTEAAWARFCDRTGYVDPAECFA